MARNIEEPVLGEEDRRAFQEFYRVLERVRPEIDEAVERAARRSPTFARILEQQDPATRERQSRLTRESERAALLEDRWRDYLDNLAEQGAAYAAMGIDFSDWHVLLSAYRGVIHRALIPADQPQAREILSGMGRFLDIAMSTVAEAYIATKEDLVRKAESEIELYRKMYENSTLGKMIYEWESPPDRGTFRLLSANPTARIFNPRIGESVGATVRESSPELVGSEVLEHWAASVLEGEARTWTARLEDAAGRERFYDARCFSMGGRTVGVVFEEVTERKRLERDIERYVSELERSNRELDDFAYVASHDLRAPLRDIDTLAGWVVEDSADLLPPDSRRHLGTLRDRIARMERLLDDLLQYSRAGRLVSEPESFDPRVVIDEAVELSPPPSGFELIVRGEASSVQAPRAALAQVVRNLVGNAIKHHHREHGRVAIELSDLSGDWIQIAVEDDGPGIPEEFHRRVFRMFQTLRPRDELEGSGMGLAIVKKLVESHGGSISLGSAPGSGTRVSFTWPKRWNGERRPLTEGGST